MFVGLDEVDTELAQRRARRVPERGRLLRHGRPRRRGRHVGHRHVMQPLLLVQLLHVLLVERVRLDGRQRGRVGLQRHDGRGGPRCQLVDDQLLRRDGGAAGRRLRRAAGYSGSGGGGGGRVTVQHVVVVMVRQQVMRVNVLQMDAVGGRR